MKLGLVCGLFLTCLGLFADSPTVYVGDRYQHHIAAITTDAAGNTLVTGSRVFLYPPQGTFLLPNEKAEVFVAKLDAKTNERLWIQYFSGKDSDAGTAVATDREGNVYVAGTTNSPNFPLRNSLQSERAGAFLLKLSSDGSRLLWSTYYGVIGTKVSSIAIAPDGAVVLGGSITANAFQDNRAVVTKIDANGNRVLWEQQFYGSQLACTGGSSCFTSARLNSAVIAVDPLGNIYAAGNTNTVDFPTTTGAFLEKGYGPYIVKLNLAGQVLWSTYLTNSRVGVGYPVSPADRLTAITVGQDGSVYLTGAGSPNWPTTSGAYRTKYEGPDWPPFGPPGTPNTYIAKMNGTGTALLYSTFAGRNNSTPGSIAVDTDGNAYISSEGIDTSTPDYITEVNATGSTLLLDNTYTTGSRGARIAIDAMGRLHAVGGAAGVVTIVDRTAASSELFGVANAAGSSAVGRIAPGELISIYGRSLGDHVLFDDVAIPLLYSSPDQINAIVPFSPTGGERITISVRKNGIETGKAVVALTEAQPEIFKLTSRQAAALNEDGSVNSNTNPAKEGSLITVWGTGAAGWPRDISVGSANPVAPLLYLPMNASVNYSSPSQVTFAGAAPGMVAGIFQINVRLPESVYGQEVSLVSIYPFSGLEFGSAAYVYVKP